MERRLLFICILLCFLCARTAAPGLGAESEMASSKESTEVVHEVQGMVYCLSCFEENLEKRPLEGALVEFSCEGEALGGKGIVAYGKTGIQGNYSMTMEGFGYAKYGESSCQAKLYAAPKGSSCNLTTDLNSGNKGAWVYVQEQQQHVLVLQAKPFAYASATIFQCSENPSSPAVTPYLNPSNRPFNHSATLTASDYSPPPPPAQRNSSETIIKTDCIKIGDEAICVTTTTTTTHNVTQTVAKSKDKKSGADKKKTSSLFLLFIIMLLNCMVF